MTRHALQFGVAGPRRIAAGWIVAAAVWLGVCLPLGATAQDGAPPAVKVSRLGEWADNGVLKLGFEVEGIADPTFPVLPWSRQRNDPVDATQPNPHYVRGHVPQPGEGKIEPHGGDKCFVIEANGGNAAYRYHAAYSTEPDGPPGYLPVHKQFTYRISAWVAARGVPLRGLEKTVPEVVAVTVDGQGKTVGSMVLAGTARQLAGGKWVRLEATLGRELVAEAAGLWVFVRMRGRALKGYVAFDDILVERLPQAQLISGEPDMLFVESDRPTTHRVTVVFEGLERENYLSRMELIGPDGRVTPFERIVRRHSRAEDKVAAILNRADAPQGTYQDRIDWSLPFAADRLPFGMYTLVHRLYLGERLLQTQRRSLAYLRRFERAAGGGLSFGVSVEVPDGDDPVLTGLLTKLGVRWVKVPVWSAETTERLEAMQQLDPFFESLAAVGIRPVGVLSAPPRSIVEALAGARVGSGVLPQHAGRMAPVLASPPEHWQGLFRATVMRLGNRVNWWQLGDDADPSYYGRTMAAALNNVRGQLEAIDLRKNLAVPVDVLYCDPGVLARGADAVTIPVGAELQARQIVELAERIEPVSPNRWIGLKLADRRLYGHEKQIMDMVTRMVYTMKGKWDTVFLGPLADDGVGLLAGDRSPGATYLAARTLVSELSGFRMLEHVSFPSGVEGFFFADADDNAKLVAWAETPTAFDVYLGEDVRVTDLAGNVKPWRYDNEHRTWPVGRWPQVFSNINSNLLRTRLSFRIDPPDLMLTSMSQRVKLKMTNFFPQPIDGAVELTFPENWKVDRELLRFSLSGNTDWEAPLRIYLPRTAEAGSIDIKAKVKINVTKRIGETKQDFAVTFNRPVDVRARDFAVDVRMEQSADDKDLYFFEVEVRNISDRYLNLTCLMSPPGMMPDEKPLPVLAPGGRTYRTFRLRADDRLRRSRIRFLVRDRRGEHFVNKTIMLGSSDFYQL